MWDLPPYRSKRTPADDAAFRDAVLRACRELFAEGVYPSFDALRSKGVRGGSHRVLSVRDDLLANGEVTTVRKTRLAGHGQRHPKRDPLKPTDDPADVEGPCWRERRLFWSTEAGKRTRALLLKPSQPEVQS